MRETCSECGKPLGATVEKCFEHGGSRPESNRITADEWHWMLGIR